MLPKVFVHNHPDLRRIAETVNALIDRLAFSSDAFRVKTFAASIRGSSTAGTYEIETQDSYYYRIGELVFLNIDITLASSITGGGSGALQIIGLPIAKRAHHAPVGSVAVSGVDFVTAGYLFAGFENTTTESSTLGVTEVNDDGAFTGVQVTALSASDRIALNISYLAAH